MKPVFKPLLGGFEVKTTVAELKLTNRFINEILRPLSLMRGLPIEHAVSAADEAVDTIIGYMTGSDKPKEEAKPKQTP